MLTLPSELTSLIVAFAPLFSKSTWHHTYLSQEQHYHRVRVLVRDPLEKFKPQALSVAFDQPCML
jgi:hypothetical protein